MKALILGLAVMAGIGFQAAQDTVDYTNQELDLAFTVPKAWQQSEKKGTTTFVMPIPDSQSTAKLEIFSVTFSSTIDIWQSVQKDTAEQKKHEVVRQWQEEFLGVPLLMTQTKYTEKGADLMNLAGIVYSSTPRKLLFRLTTPAGDFDKAVFAFRNVLQTGRTIDGIRLQPQDPNKVDNVVYPAGKDFHQFRDSVKSRPEAPAVLAKGSTDLTTGGKAWKLHHPTEWTAEKNEDGSFSFKREGLTVVAKVQVNSELDSEPFANALFRISAATLDNFDAGPRRIEKGPSRNKAGATVVEIWRSGKKDKSEVFSIDAGGESPGVYWLLSWVSNDAKSSGRDRKLIEELIDQMSVEPGT